MKILGYDISKISKSPVEKKGDSIEVNTTQPLSLTPSFVTTANPVWRNLSELIYLLNCYHENPVVNAIINIKAEAFANMRFKVKVLKTGEIFPLNEFDMDGGKLKNLMKKPNPLQSTYEWLRQSKVNYEVFGNAYVYGSVPVGWEKKFSYKDIQVINNLPSYCVSKVLTGKWLDATTKEEIISKYIFSGFNNKKKEIHPNTLLHLNNVNITFDQNFTDGTSDLIALQKPISNIDGAYESRNVLIKKRGALGILTSEKRDEAMGNLPLKEDEIKEVQDAFQKYGLMDDQYSQIISPHPLKYTRMALSVKELMLFEEVEADAIAVAVAKGVPELLVKYYIKSGTYENQDASEKRLYDSTIIPESIDFMVGLNSFLNTEEQGYELIGSYDHLNILQANQKEQSETKGKNVETAIKAFMIGAVVYNEVLKAMELPQDTTIGEKRIWDLTPEQLAALKINTPQTNGSH